MLLSFKLFINYNNKANLIFILIIVYNKAINTSDMFKKILWYAIYTLEIYCSVVIFMLFHKNFMQVYIIYKL